MFSRFTGKARDVLIRAREEAARLGHREASPEHFLLGLTRENEGLGVVLVRNLGADPEEIRSKVESMVTHGSETLRPEGVSLSQSGKRAIECARMEAQSLGHDYIGTEHLLLGIIREADESGLQVIRKLEIDLDRARAEVRRVLGED